MTAGDGGNERCPDTVEVTDMARTAPSPTRTDWFDEADCRDADTTLFFPVSESGAAAAKAICETCPVREACLEFAVDTRQPDGVWGGMTPIERHRLIRRRQKAARKERARTAA